MTGAGRDVDGDLLQVVPGLLPEIVEDAPGFLAGAILPEGEVLIGEIAVGELEVLVEGAEAPCPWTPGRG